MIQRVQTIYLLISSILSALLVYLHIGTLKIDDTFYKMEAMGMTAADGTIVNPTWAILILVALTALLPLIAIFLYKKRVLQMRMTNFSTLLTIAVIGLFAYYIYTFLDNSFVGFSPSFYLSFPFIVIILNYLAARRIAIDDRLVKSLDRLR